jgi:hypothetical protein
LPDKSHRRVAAPGVGKKFSLSGKGKACLLKPVFTDRPCHDPAKAPFAATCRGRLHRFQRERCALERRLARCDHKVRLTDELIAQTQSVRQGGPPRFGANKDTIAAAQLIDTQNSFDHLRTNPGRIAASDRKWQSWIWLNHGSIERSHAYRPRRS